MIREDARGRRLIIVADLLINPESAFYADVSDRFGPVLDVLIEDGWGMLKLPPHVLGDEVGKSAATTLAGDAVDYLRHDYTVLILAVDQLPQGGLWLNYLKAAFGEMGVAVPSIVRLRADDKTNINTAASIRTMLAAACGVVVPLG